MRIVKLVIMYKLQQSFNASFSIPTMKSPTKIKHSYFEDCKSRFLLSDLRCSPIKTLDGLYEQFISHFCPLQLNSTLTLSTGSFSEPINFAGISSRTNIA